MDLNNFINKGFIIRTILLLLLSSCTSVPENFLWRKELLQNTMGSFEIICEIGKSRFHKLKFIFSYTSF